MPKSKELKRQEAEVRKAEHDARTANEQMSLVSQRPGGSSSERIKLFGLIEDGRASAKLGKVTK